MPDHGGTGDDLIPETLEGLGWPSLRQFVVFLENRVGRLSELMRHVESMDVRVLSISIVDTVDCANVRLIFSQADRARERLELANFLFAENDVVGVVLPDDDQPLATVCAAVLKGELNIHHASFLRLRLEGRPTVAMYVDDVDLAARTLRDAGLTVITESDTQDSDEFF